MRRDMKTFLRENLLGLSLTMVGLLCLVATIILHVGEPGRFPGFAFAEGQGLSGPEFEELEKQNRAYEKIAQTVTPAIVNIRTTQITRVEQSPFFADPFFRQFFGDMFGQFGVPREQRKHALGSGVLLSSDGYIITNEHVIRRASEIEVMLSDRRIFKAKIVGTDPRSDIAVIKIEGKGLPTAPWGDSNSLKPGAIVMAFGNPFGLSFTVTRGSVNAVGRSGLGIEDYEDFIQTDAAINPGNSGGALVNVRGQVVGINTAILSPSQGGGQGGWAGVGFAIPSNTARNIMESIIKTGKVVRGYLGVTPGDLNPALARQFKVPDISGVLVNQVEPNGPADKAGLKQGDVIRTLNGKTVDGTARFRALVAGMNPGTEITLRILREGRSETIKITLVEQPATVAGTDGGQAQTEGTLRGIMVQNLTPAIREELGLPSTRGVVIADLDPSAPAARVGLQPGDVIQSINRQPIDSVAEFNRLAAQARGEILLRVNRQGSSAFVVLPPDGE